MQLYTASYVKPWLEISYRLYTMLKSNVSILQTAIAASINLRCFAILNRRPDHKLRLDLPDLHLYEKEWSINRLPWDAFTAKPLQCGSAPKELDAGSLQAVEGFLHDDGLDATAHVAALAILYLYMAMSNHGNR